MKEILFIILFWLSTIGYCLYIKNQFNLKNELILPFTFICISIIEFVFGIFNILILGSVFILIAGLALFVVRIRKDFNKIVSFIKKADINFIIIFGLLLYVTIIFFNSHFLHYDNFSHWATIIKYMILNNSLPNFEATAIEFKAYQPGTACFIYYFTHFSGLKEGMMVIAQNYLFIAFSSSILVFAKGKFKQLFRILSLIVIFYMWTINIMPNDLLVDTILMAIMVYIFVLFIEYKNNLNKLFYILLPAVLFLCLVKNCGFILAFIVCCLNLFVSIINKEFKKGLKNSLILGLSCIGFLVIWSAHVKYGYGELGLNSHHALTLNNIFAHIRTVGIEKILDFIKFYLRHFVDLENNFGNLMMIIVNILLISMLLIFKNKNDKKYLLMLLIVIDSIYLMYYVALGMMYICSMEESGLFALAGFDRYLFTIVGALTVLFIIGFISRFNDFKKIYIYIYSVIIIILCLLFIGFYNKKDFKITNSYQIFIGNIDYEETTAYLFDKFLGKKYINLNNEYPYFVYYSNLENDYGFLYYLSRYKFNHGNIIIARNVEDIKNYSENSLIFELKSDDTFKKKMKELNFCEVDEKIYLKCKENS